MVLSDTPNFRLSAASPTARGFLRRSVGDYHRAIRYIRALRTTNQAWRADDYRRVLPEGGGSDAAKHAVLAALAHEHNVPVRLVLGIYEVVGGDTPGAAAVLRSAGLDTILDADCFISYEGTMLHLASDREPAETLRFLHMEPIRPEDIGEYRLAVYHRFLWEWTQARGLEMAEAWEVRQRWLEARLAR